MDSSIQQRLLSHLEAENQPAKLMTSQVREDLLKGIKDIVTATVKSMLPSHGTTQDQAVIGSVNPEERPRGFRRRRHGYQAVRERENNKEEVRERENNKQDGEEDRGEEEDGRKRRRTVRGGIREEREPRERMRKLSQLEELRKIYKE
ncbi:hypothetical protein I305_06303 [Cryptococcus gattii E566]|nr:hypothetical protein I305_06303 [Cryptococcus gattii E566]